VACKSTRLGNLLRAQTGRRVVVAMVVADRRMGGMPLVCIDTNLIDVFVAVGDIRDASDAIEAREPPPVGLDGDERAAWWLLMLGVYWPSLAVVCSDQLFDELASMPPHKLGWATWCLGFALDLRAGQPDELLAPDPTRRPPESLLQTYGLDPKDAVHIADAVGLGASHFLTRDRGILKRAARLQPFGLRIQKLTEFVNDAYAAGAPFPLGMRKADL
jgi:hypothetical protein